MTPENLKRIAEYIGYEVPTSFDFLPKENEVWIKTDEFIWQIYNPLTNPEQLLELIEKLASIGCVELDCSLDCAPIVTYDSIDYTAKTLPEAVIKAVLEMIKEK
mgnify:CR=1 FL=1